MGQVSSQVDKNDDKQEVTNIVIEQSIGADHISSYRGIKSNDSGSNSEGETKSNSNEEIKIPTHFEWNEGGKCVYLTGTFSNWNQWFVMNKSKDDRYEITLVTLLNSGFTERKPSV